MPHLPGGYWRSVALLVIAAATVSLGLAPARAAARLAGTHQSHSARAAGRAGQGDGCAGLLRHPGHFFGVGNGHDHELPGDKRVASEPFVAVSVQGAPLSPHGGKVTVSYRAYPGTKIRRFPKLTNAAISIGEGGAAHQRGIAEKFRSFVPMPRNGRFSVTLKLDRPTGFYAAVTLEFPRQHKPRYENAVTTTCVPMRFQVPKLRATRFLAGGRSDDELGPFELPKRIFVLDGKPVPASAGELFERVNGQWQATGGNLASGQIADPPYVPAGGLHKFRIQGGADGYLGASNVVSVYVVPLRGKSAALDKDLNGDDKAIYDLELQIAQNYCRGLGDLISEPGSVSGLTAPEIAVLTKMEGDFTTSICEGHRHALFDLFDHAGTYLSDYLAAKGKDAVAEKIVIPALDALLEKVDTDPADYSSVLGHWLTDSGFDAVSHSISDCNDSVCSSIASGAKSLYHSLTDAE